MGRRKATMFRKWLGDLFAKRCDLDGSPYHKVGEAADGQAILECEYGHKYYSEAPRATGGI